MFKKKIWCILLFSFMTLCLYVGIMVFIVSADRSSYKQLMESSNFAKQSSKINSYQTQQKRIRVSKQILLKEEKGQRSQFRLQSASSDILFNHSNGQIEMLEDFHHLVCSLQEELFYQLPDGREAILQEEGRCLVRRADPSQPTSWVDMKDPLLIPRQSIRYIEAENATYHYGSEELFAKQAKLARYCIAGHQLPESFNSFKPIMMGMAGKVTVSLASPNLHFKAQGFKATFQPEENSL